MDSRLGFLVAALSLSGAGTIPARPGEVLVYGATPAGIAASIAAAKSGERVTLVEPTGRIGGMVTNGLSHTDFRTFEGITGTFYELTQRTIRYYETKGISAEQCFRGTHAEPHVNLLLFERMLAEQPRITVLKEHPLAEVTVDGARIRSATFGEGKSIAADVFIDASYEGDLMAAAGVTWRAGREARSEYDESLAPDKADRQLQGYNFRLITTRDPKNRLMPERPAGYDREEFLPVLKLLGTAQVKSVFCRSTGGLYKAHLPALPNGKYDVNDVSRGAVRLSLPGANTDWPAGNAAVRRSIFDEHLRHNVGLLYFLQNDEEVPAKFRDEARQWGWCRDEFTETGGIPEQLYVREARRMKAEFVFTEQCTDYADGDARAVLFTDAIAMGDYGPNCHGTAHEGPRMGGRHTGEFYKQVPPYQISRGVLHTAKVENLLVPVACSASHVGFCALRLEPIWTSLGQASGYFAHRAIRSGVAVGEVPVAEVQGLLHADGAATIYVSDVLPGHPDFAAVQWWATAGGLHGLAPPPEKPGQRGAHLLGQYFEAYPNHAAGLDEPIGDDLRKRWLALAERLQANVGALSSAKSRGEFIRVAYHAALRQADPKPRVVVLTDITNEPDDAMSLVRFLTYAEVFDVEGLIATTSCWKRDTPALSAMHEVLDAYAKVHPNLVLHSSDYPEVGALRAITKAGVDGYGMGPAAAQLENEGVDLIISVLDKDDPRPVWFSVWGGGNTLGAAVMKLQKERPADVARLVAKMRGYEIALQDDAFAYISKHFPDTKLISAKNLWRGISRTTPKFNQWPESWGGDDSLFDANWVEANVQRGHGALGEAYPSADYLWEGDTPSFFYMIPNGLHFPEHVEFGGWGGRFAPERQKNVRSGTGNNTVDGLLDKHRDYFLFSDASDKWAWEDKTYKNVYATVFRWREAFQNDFAARMDRCVKPYDTANHAPRAVVNGDISLALFRVQAEPGERIELDASASTDVDGDTLSHRWWYYPEPGSYRGELAIDGSASPRATVLVPPLAKGEDFHLILETVDDGSPPLHAYRRILVTVR